MGRSLGAAVLGVDALGFLKLVFEDDDPACRLDRGAAVDEFTRTGRDTQLIARVAAVSTLGAQWRDQPCFAEDRRKPGVVPSISAARPIV